MTRRYATDSYPFHHREPPGGPAPPGMVPAVTPPSWPVHPRDARARLQAPAVHRSRRTEGPRRCGGDYEQIAVGVEPDDTAPNTMRKGSLPSWALLLGEAGGVRLCPACTRVDGDRSGAPKYLSERLRMRTERGVAVFAVIPADCGKRQGLSESGHGRAVFDDVRTSVRASWYARLCATPR